MNLLLLVLLFSRASAADVTCSDQRGQVGTTLQAAYAKILPLFINRNHKILASFRDYLLRDKSQAGEAARDAVDKYKASTQTKDGFDTFVGSASDTIAARSQFTVPLMALAHKHELSALYVKCPVTADYIPKTTKPPQGSDDGVWDLGICQNRRSHKMYEQPLERTVLSVPAGGGYAGNLIGPLQVNVCTILNGRYGRKTSRKENFQEFPVCTLYDLRSGETKDQAPSYFYDSKTGIEGINGTLRVDGKTWSEMITAALPAGSTCQDKPTNP